MHINHSIYLLFCLSLTSHTILGQYFENPSFEGEPGISLCPPGWQAMDAASTPDTGPLPCDTFAAFDGTTYVTLVARGTDHPAAGTRERMIAGLLKPLEEGRYYRLTLALASRKDLGHFTWEEGFIAYTSPLRLQVFAGDGGSSSGELLIESDPIAEEIWANQSFYINPGGPVAHLVFAAAAPEDPSVSGNLLLDHLRIEALSEPPLGFGELAVPDVFTPNGDGYNDRFVIKGLPEGSELFVFDRTGTEVFYSSPYANQWDGRDKKERLLPQGTYWYILNTGNDRGTVKGYVYLKRE